nr:hypothetical protein [Stenotrophomonas maltophilia]
MLEPPRLPAPPAPASLPEQPLRLSADAFFGFDSAVLSAEGRGAAEPIVQCEQRKRREPIACLAPNRRVQIAGMTQPH